uniref:Nodulin-like domain-containing protein n=1 Tax=Chenopodium quinoa TaxID=63459 RepID=A0A803L900_CHEQI
MSIVSMLLAAYLMIILILEDILVFPHWARLLNFLVLILFLSLPLKIATEANKKEKSQPLLLKTEPLLYDSNDSNEPEKSLVGEENVELCQESMNILEAMGSINFWLLFLAILCGMGSGLATINNMSQLGQSLSYNTSKINTLVSLWSIWNFFGRFGAGYISDILLRRRGWARPLVMVVALGAMTIGHVIIGSGFFGNLYIGTILVGICYGALWSLMPTITSEIFGVLHMGTIYNAIAMANPLGTYVLSVWVIGHIYDEEAGEHNSCLGVHCFMVSFFVLAFVSFLGFIVALTLFFRTRVFYRSVVLRRLHYSLRRYNSRWIALASSIWIEALLGGIYTFSIYSPVLKTSQSYDQSTLNTVSVFKDIGSTSGVLSGLLYTAASSRYSVPWVVHVLGAAEGFLGYFSMWLAVVGVIPRPPVPLMCLFMFVAAHFLTFFNTWNVVTSVQNFPECSVQNKNPLNAMSIVSILLATYLMIIIVMEAIFVFPQWARLLSFLVLLSFLSLPLKVATEANNEEKSHPLLVKDDALPPCDDADSNEPEKSLVGEEVVELCHENMNLLEAMGSFNFWLLFLVTLCGMGSGLATINNMSQLGESLGYDTTKTNTLVSLWSIWNFFGRLGAGYTSDILLRQRGWARPLVMAIALGAMTVGHLIISSGFVGNLYIGTILVGICYGALWSLMPTIASEIFGVLHLGTIYNAIAIANPLGTYVLSVWVIGHIYDKEAAEQNTCLGVHCFMVSFFVLAFVSLLGFLVALTLFFRTRVFYGSVVLRKLHRSLNR